MKLLKKLLESHLREFENTYSLDTRYAPNKDMIKNTRHHINNFIKDSERLESPRKNRDGNEVTLYRHKKTGTCFNHIAHTDGHEQLVAHGSNVMFK